MKLEIVVRRVTEQEDANGVLTAVRFRHLGPPPTKISVPPAGVLMFVNELSFVYPGSARHRVGDMVSIAIDEVPRG